MALAPLLAASSGQGGSPYIVTAELPVDLGHWADRLRRTHYPPDRNQIAAHVTLFHAMAPSLVGELKSLLARLAGEFAAPPARLTGIMPLGGGTALAIDSPAMLTIREEIAAYFHGALTQQDSHAPRLHITIQNKVTASEAKSLQISLLEQMEERRFRFAGLGLHRYLGGPWEPVGKWSFRGKLGG